MDARPVAGIARAYVDVVLAIPGGDEIWCGNYMQGVFEIVK
jgi:hypothetical protein